MTTINLPISTETLWALLALLGLVTASGLIVLIMPKPSDGSQSALENLQAKLNLSAMPPITFLIATVIWLALLALLISGLFITVSSAIFAEIPEDRDAVWNFRFLFAQLAALAAVAGATVALPFTLIRLRLSDRQTRIQEEGHLTDRFSKAVEGLGTVREFKRIQTNDEGEPLYMTNENGDADESTPAYEEVSAPNLEVRIGAIHSLVRLAKDAQVEDREMIVKLLTSYARSNDWAKHLGDWRADFVNNSISRIQPDVFEALVALVSLREDPIETYKGVQTCTDLRYIDLSNFLVFGIDLSFCDLRFAKMTKTRFFDCNLRGSELHLANLNGAHFVRCNLNGSTFSATKCEGTVFKSDTRLHGACILNTDLSEANIEEDEL